MVLTSLSAVSHAGAVSLLSPFDEVAETWPDQHASQNPVEDSERFFVRIMPGQKQDQKENHDAADQKDKREHDAFAKLCMDLLPEIQMLIGARLDDRPS